MASLNEVRQRARDIGVSNILTEEYDDFHGFVPWDDKNPTAALVPQRYMVENRVQDYTEVQPNAGFSPGSFLAGSTVDFKLDTADVSVIDHAFLVFEVSNTTGGNVTLPPTSFWFEKIEVLAPNGNTITTIQDTDNWMAMCMLPRTDFEQIAALTNTNDNYSTAGVVIANNATSELYLPLWTLITACRLHLPSITGHLTFRFRAKASALNLIAGTHPTFTRVVMLLGGFDEPQDKRNVRTATLRGLLPRFRKTPVYLPFLGWDRFTFSQALQPSTRVEMKLNGLRGQFAGLFVLIRALPLTAANQGTFIALSSLSVQDESNAIFCGNHVKSHARSRIIAASQLQNLAARNVNFYLIPFSASVVSDFAVGQNHGFQIFKGNESLAFTPTAALVAGNYQIDVLALRSQAIRLQSGQVDIRR